MTQKVNSTKSPSPRSNKNRKSPPKKQVLMDEPQGEVDSLELEPEGLEGVILQEIDGEPFKPDEGDLLDSEVEIEEATDESGEIVAAPSLTLELSEDPVRLYLKEIGQIELLTAESEFRLATRNEAKKRLDWLMERENASLKDDERIHNLFCHIIKDLLESYKNLQAFCQSNPVVELPDFTLVLAESQALRQQWECDEPSYTRDYLNTFWRENEHVSDPIRQQLLAGFIQEIYAFFLAAYLLPESLALYLLEQLRSKGNFPTEKTCQNHLPDVPDLKKNIRAVSDLSEDATQNLIKANLRLVVSVAKRYLGPGFRCWISSRKAIWACCALSPSSTRTRFQIQHLRHLVDPPIDQPPHCRTGAHHSHPRAFI
jgi:RNA polymerase primary sigma factor